MGGTSVNGVCRLVVCGPDRRIEVAVPTHVVVADLLPVLLQHLGDGLPDTGLLHGGWVLQRPGQAPVDEEATVAALRLRDGETVHVRPRDAELPPIDFDDVVDGIATGLRERAGRWRPEMIRWAAGATTAVALAAGAAALLVPGPPRIRAVACLAAVVCCLLAAAGLAREHGFAVVVAAGASGYAAVGGLLVPDPAAAWPDPVRGPAAALGAAVAVAVTALVAAVLLQHARPLFTGVVTGAVLVAGGAAAATYVPLTGHQAAALVTVIGTVVTTMVPLAAFGLARLRLDPLPTEPAHIQENLDPEPAGPLLARTAVADRFMTAIHSGLSVPVAGAVVLLGLAPGWAAATLVLLAALVRLLQARPMSSGWHRLALIVPAVAGLLTVTMSAVSHGPWWAGVGFAVGVVPLVVVQAVGLARTLPLRRPTPYWGRAGDLAQTALVIALVPVLFAVLGVYGFARGIGG